jgi:membrane-associated protease RseP (regulator of RpoE activity)
VIPPTEQQNGQNNLEPFAILWRKTGGTGYNGAVKEEKDMAAMICPQCHAQVMDKQRFCRYCGYRLDQGLQDYVATETFDRSSPSTYTPGQYLPRSAPWMTPAPVETTRMRTSHRRRKVLGFVWGLALCCAIAGGIVYRAVSDRSPGNAPIAAQAQPSYLGVYFGDEDRGGAFIESIATDGGPADQAGLIEGDLIIEANGQPIRNNDEMRRFLAATPAGTQIPIKILRDGERLELTLVTGAREDFAGSSAPAQPYGFFGIDPGDLERVRVPGKNSWGVRLDDVLENDPADIAGIREGDIVIEFNGHPIRTPRELLRQIRKTEPYQTIDVKIVRDGREVIIPVKMGRNG